MYKQFFQVGIFNSIHKSNINYFQCFQVCKIFKRLLPRKYFAGSFDECRLSSRCVDLSFSDFLSFQSVCLYLCLKFVSVAYFVCMSILGMSVWMSLSVSLLKVCPSIPSLKSFLDPCPRCLTLSAKKWKFKFHWQIQNWCSEDRQTSGMDAVCLISPSFSFRNKSQKVKIISSFSLTMQVKQIKLIFIFIKTCD